MLAINSGISVVEIPARGQVIPVSREAVAAFIGPTLRGPVDMPVAVRSLEEFLARFGVPGHYSRMELLLGQFFDNGGSLAVVVRVCRSRRRNRIALPGPAGPLVLEALHPGPLEYLRACVDYAGLATDERDRFNLVIHRCASPEQPLVEEQESFTGVSVRPGDAEFIGDVLASSALVRLAEEPPAERPFDTIGTDPLRPVRYVYGRSDAAHADISSNAPTDYDLIGSREEGTGLFALELVPWVDFICLMPGSADVALGPVALFAAERYCRERQALLILDPPQSWRSVRDVVEGQRGHGLASPNVVTYFPPLDSAAQTPAPGIASAAGAIAGRLAAVGFEPVASLPLALGRSRPALDLDDGDIHQLGRLGVNAIARSTPTRVELAGLVSMARCGGMTVSWNDLRQRRVFLFIVSSIARHTRWAVYETPGSSAWPDVRRECRDFLAALHARGLLAGETEREAFYVKCDVDTNRATSGSAAARLALVVGVALARPGRFVAVEIRHEADSCTVAELGWQPGPELALAS